MHVRLSLLPQTGLQGQGWASSLRLGSKDMLGLPPQIRGSRQGLSSFTMAVVWVRPSPNSLVWQTPFSPYLEPRSSG